MASGCKGSRFMKEFVMLGMRILNLKEQEQLILGFMEPR